MGLLKLFNNLTHSTSSSRQPDAPPPEWSAAPESIHPFGKYNEAPEDEYEAGEDFCERYPVSPAKLLSSQETESIQSFGCKAWTMQEPGTWRFKGTVTQTETGSAVIRTKSECLGVCVMSNLPILAGLYDVPAGMEGVYFEVVITKMEGIVAVGTACQPYPNFRLPGWNRLSAGFHLDDLRKFFEDPDGGRDYISEDFMQGIRGGDVVGCGYEFGRGAIFFTYNGIKLPDAFMGVYLPRTKRDVYAAIGLSGRCEVEVNFGGEVFRWKEGNDLKWRMDRHVGCLSGPSRDEEAPPAYSLLNRSALSSL